MLVSFVELDYSKLSKCFSICSLKESVDVLPPVRRNIQFDLKFWSRNMYIVSFRLSLVPLLIYHLYICSAKLTVISYVCLMRLTNVNELRYIELPV